MNFKRIWSTVFLITAIAWLAGFAQAQALEAGQMRLYVGNLSFQTSSEDLWELFSQAGTVVSAEVVEDKESGRSRGYAFVVMASREEGNNAIQMINGRDVGGRTVYVNEARPREKAPQENELNGSQLNARKIEVKKAQPERERLTALFPERGEIAFRIMNDSRFADR